MSSNKQIKDAKEVFYKNTITFQAGVKKVSTMSDKTLDILLNTQELPEDTMAQLFRLNHCAVCMAPHGEEILPFDPAEMDVPKDKSPSQRLRAVLFLCWKNDPSGYKDFNQWYIIKMEEMISHFKEKLDN